MPRLALDSPLRISLVRYIVNQKAFFLLLYKMEVFAALWQSIFFLSVYIGLVFEDVILRLTTNSNAARLFCADKKSEIQWKEVELYKI